MSKETSDQIKKRVFAGLVVIPAFRAAVNAYVKTNKTQRKTGANFYKSIFRPALENITGLDFGDKAFTEKAVKKIKPEETEAPNTAGEKK